MWYELQGVCFGAKISNSHLCEDRTGSTNVNETLRRMAEKHHATECVFYETSMRLNFPRKKNAIDFFDDVNYFFKPRMFRTIPGGGTDFL